MPFSIHLVANVCLSVCGCTCSNSIPKLFILSTVLFNILLYDELDTGVPRLDLKTISSKSSPILFSSFLINFFLFSSSFISIKILSTFSSIGISRLLDFVFGVSLNSFPVTSVSVPVTCIILFSKSISFHSKALSSPVRNPVLSDTSISFLSVPDEYFINSSCSYNVRTLLSVFSVLAFGIVVKGIGFLFIIWLL